jgi:phage-related minor tail protein
MLSSSHGRQGAPSALAVSTSKMFGQIDADGARRKAEGADVVQSAQYIAAEFIHDSITVG